MLRRIATVVGGLVLVMTAVGTVLIVGMRTKSPPVLRTVRRVNREVFNPRQMRSAGTPGAYASIIQHVGRKSGKDYETPVGTVPTDDGYVITLPYGSEADWLKNVLANGSATITAEGETHEVHKPQLVACEDVAEFFSTSDLRAMRLFGVSECLVVRKVDPAHIVDLTPETV